MSDWSADYAQICEEFHYSQEADKAAAIALAPQVPAFGWRDVGIELKHRAVVHIVGCAQSLEELQARDLPDQGIVVAADGATERLLELGIVPRVIVTDLDGRNSALQDSSWAGSALVIHAHGDNSQQFARLPDFGPIRAGTYQPPPWDGAPASMRCGYGFTDGDRAVMLAVRHGVRAIHLHAFSDHEPPSRYTGRTNLATKSAKLAWMSKLISQANEGHIFGM